MAPLSPLPPQLSHPPYPCFSLFSLCVAVTGCLFKLPGDVGGAKPDDYKKAILYIPFLPMFTIYIYKCSQLACRSVPTFYTLCFFIDMCICAQHMKYICSSHFIALKTMKKCADAGVHIGKAEVKLDDDNKMYIIYCRIIA